MSMRDFKVNVSWHIIADIDDCMVVAFCVNGKIAFIVSGRPDELYEKIRKVFNS
jgi:hypothetical protein